MRRAMQRSQAARATCWLAGAAFVFVVATGAAAADRHDPALAAKGKTTYVRYCVSCHGPEGRADGPLARDLAVPVPDLTTLAARGGGTYPHDRVVRIITHGEPLRGHGTADMPAWGDAFKKTAGIAAPTADAAIRNVGHYIWSLQRDAPK